MSSTRSATPDFGDSGDDDAPASLGRPPQPPPMRAPALGRPPQPPAASDYAPSAEAPAPAPSPRHHGLTHALSTAGHELVHGAESAVHFVDHAAHDAAHALEQGARRTMSLVRQVSKRIMNESLEDEASATKFHRKPPPDDARAP